jgi:hypothetical protein
LFSGHAIYGITAFATDKSDSLAKLEVAFSKKHHVHVVLNSATYEKV